MSKVSNVEVHFGAEDVCTQCKQSFATPHRIIPMRWFCAEHVGLDKIQAGRAAQFCSTTCARAWLDDLIRRCF